MYYMFYREYNVQRVYLASGRYKLWFELFSLESFVYGFSEVYLQADYPLTSLIYKEDCSLITCAHTECVIFTLNFLYVVSL